MHTPSCSPTHLSTRYSVPSVTGAHEIGAGNGEGSRLRGKSEFFFLVSESMAAFFTCVRPASTMGAIGYCYIPSSAQL